MLKKIIGHLQIFYGKNYFQQTEYIKENDGTSIKAKELLQLKSQELQLPYKEGLPGVT